MPLTDLAIRSAKARDKPYKLGDSLGLFLLVQPSGGKLWRFKYQGRNGEKKLALGTYPEIKLSAARERRDAARRQLANGIDPAQEKQRDKLRGKTQAENTFETVAREYMVKRNREGWAESTARKAEYLLDQLTPIQKLPIAELGPTDVLAVVRKIESKGNNETAKRALQFASCVFRYGVATARLGSDPTRDLRGALVNRPVKHYGAIIEAAPVGALLRAIEGYQGHCVTKLGLEFAPHVFVRPGEMRHAEWHEFDLENGVWKIPAEKMKMRKAHHVPLSRQAIFLLRRLESLTGPKGYVFPSIRSSARPMSENTINAALRRLGFSTDEMTAHGFRAMASTLLNESGKWSPDAIERALAHRDTDAVRGVYHRGAHWEERVAMAQWWSDHLDKLRTTPVILP